MDLVMRTQPGQVLEPGEDRGLAASFLVWAGVEADFIEAVHRLSPFTGTLDRRSGEEGGGQATETPGMRRLRRMLQVTGRISFPNAAVRVTGCRLVHQPQLLLRFRVSVAADEKKEWLVPVVVDPATETADRPVEEARAADFAAAPQAAPGGRYALERLYRAARRHLEKRLLAQAGEFEREAAARLARETRRVGEYYAGLLAERSEPLEKVYRKIAAATVQAALVPPWAGGERLRRLVQRWKAEAQELEAGRQRELEALLRERERRIEELREKHRVRAEVRLVQGAYVMVPRVEWRLVLRGPARREALLCYDVLRRRLKGWECEHCGGQLFGEVLLCRCGALLCAGCCSICPECRGTACALCARASCHVCGGAVGCSCGGPCHLAPWVPGVQELEVCARCREAHCGWCGAGARFLTGEGCGGL